MNPTKTVYVIQTLNKKWTHDVRFFKSLTLTKYGRRLDRVRSMNTAKRFTNLDEANTLCEHLSRNYWLEFSVVEYVATPAVLVNQ